MNRMLIATLLGAAACGDVNKIVEIDAAVPPAPDGAVIVDDTARIEDVLVPGPVDVEGSQAVITAVVAGAPNTALTVGITGTLGTYTPAEQTVMTGADGRATASFAFTSGAEGGDASASITVAGGTPETISFPVLPLVKAGNVAALGTSGSVGQDFLLGQTITLTAPARLRRFGVITAAAGPQIKIALYADNGGNPGALVASQSAAFPLAAGVNEIPATSQVLPAGNYWFMGIYNVTGTTLTNSSGNRQIKYVSQPFANGLPSPFPAAHTTYTGNDFNYYLVLGSP